MRKAVTEFLGTAFRECDPPEMHARCPDPV